MWAAMASSPGAGVCCTEQRMGVQKWLLSLPRSRGMWFASARGQSFKNQLNKVLFCRQKGLNQPPKVCKASQVSLPVFEGNCSRCEVLGLQPAGLSVQLEIALCQKLIPAQPPSLLTLGFLEH